MEFSPDQVEKIRNFKWIDADDPEGDAQQPGSHFAMEVLECAQKVCDYVLESISIDKFDENCFSIPVPLDIHSLLAERYNSQWTNASRTAVFDIVKAACIAQIEANQRLVEERVEVVFPSKSTPEQKQAILQFVDRSCIDTQWEVGVIDKKYKLIWVRVYDEPVVNARMGAHTHIEELLSAKPEIMIELGMERVSAD